MKSVRAVPAFNAARELCVLVRCHELTLAIATQWVERLVPVGDVAVVEPDASPDAALSGHLGVIELDGARYAAWDLAAMIGVEAAPDAWVILRGVKASSDPTVVPVALRVGRCLKVTPLPKTTSLPPGVFRTRPTAWLGVARGAELSAPNDDLIGLVLDPSRLWTNAELASSRRLAREPGVSRS